MKSRARGKRAADKNLIARRMASSKVLSYHAMADLTLDAWRNGNLTAASRYFSDLANHKEASDDDRQNWVDMATGCKILAGQMKTPEHFNAMCMTCGHDRFWHVLVIACIQCLNPDTKESSCRAFVP